MRVRLLPPLAVALTLTLAVSPALAQRARTGSTAGAKRPAGGGTVTPGVVHTSGGGNRVANITAGLPLTYSNANGAPINRNVVAGTRGGVHGGGSVVVVGGLGYGAGYSYPYASAFEYPFGFYGNGPYGPTYVQPGFSSLYGSPALGSPYVPQYPQSRYGQQQQGPPLIIREVTLGNDGKPLVAPPQQPALTTPAPATVDVTVPAEDVELWFNGVKMQQTGLKRQFVTPDLTPGKTFTYQLRAKWSDSVRQYDVTRTVAVQAGAQLTVTVTASAREELPPPVESAGK